VLNLMNQHARLLDQVQRVEQEKQNAVLQLGQTQYRLEQAQTQLAEVRKHCQELLNIHKIDENPAYKELQNLLVQQENVYKGLLAENSNRYDELYSQFQLFTQQAEAKAEEYKGRISELEKRLEERQGVAEERLLKLGEDYSKL